MHETIEVLFETVFSTRFVQRAYKEENWSNSSAIGREPPFKEGISPEAEDGHC
jgi:hypothetical protein